MEKIKNLKYYAMMLIVALTSLSFAACSDDDDDFGGDSRLVGYWNDDNGRDPEVLHIIFKGDGTAKQWLTYKGKVDGEKLSFTWSTPSKGVIVVTGKHADTGKVVTEKHGYSIDNDVLTLYYYDEDGNVDDYDELHRVKK